MKSIRTITATVAACLMFTPLPAHAATGETGPLTSSQAAQLEWRLDPKVPADETPGLQLKAWDEDSGLPPFAACGRITDPLKVTASWYDVSLGSPTDNMFASEITLRCGDDSHGLKHIRKDHPEWSTLAAIEGKSGDALIRLAIDAALEKTQKSSRAGTVETGKDGKFCASSQIYLVNKVRGTVEKTLEPTIIVAEHGHHVISVYPTDKSRCQ